MTTKEDSITVIEESCGDMQVWIPTGEKWDGKKVFMNSRDGITAIRTSENRMERISDE